MIVGFNWGGWSLESTAAKRADEAYCETRLLAIMDDKWCNFLYLCRIQKRPRLMRHSSRALGVGYNERGRPTEAA
jgi:hypothetical protein